LKEEFRGLGAKKKVERNLTCRGDVGKNSGVGNPHSSQKKKKRLGSTDTTTTRKHSTHPSGFRRTGLHTRVDTSLAWGGKGGQSGIGGNLVGRKLPAREKKKHGPGRGLKGRKRKIKRHRGLSSPLRVK